MAIKPSESQRLIIPVSLCCCNDRIIGLFVDILDLNPNGSCLNKTKQKILTLNTSKDVCSCNTQNTVCINFTIDTQQYVEKFNWVTLWY